MDQNSEGNGSNERVENAEFADRDANDSNSTEATSMVAPVCVVSTGVWHPSSSFPNLGPAYNTGWSNMATPFATNPYFSTIYGMTNPYAINPYGYGFMLPPIMPSNYTYPNAYAVGGSISNKPNCDQTWFNWGGQQGGITGEGVVIGENLASNIQNPERLSTSSDSPKACDDFNMAGPGITLRKWVESKCSNAGKKEKMRLFRNIMIVVDVEHSRGKALLELWPSSFIIFEMGRVKYVGSLATTEATGNSRKRDIQPKFSLQDDIREKMQKLDADKLEMPRPSSENKTNTGVGENTSAGNTLVNAWLEKKWYAFPEGFDVTDLLSLNVYSLGFLLFEVLCHFDTIEERSVAMLDLHEQILPPSFLCKSPKEAKLCLWLLNPDLSLRPTTREILESELIYGIDGMDERDEVRVSEDMEDEMGLDVLHDFLVSSEQHMQSEASNLSESIKTLEGDINAIENKQACSQSSNNTGASTSEVSNGCADKIRDKLYLNLGELENIYLSMKSNPLYAESTSTSRPDIDVLTQRNELSLAQDLQNLAEEKSVDPVGIFFDGICKFAQYEKFEVCGMLRNRGVPDSNNIISSLGFDRDEQYMATTGSEKIKIFELDSFLDNTVDVHYPILEMSGQSNFTCLCWNHYIKNYVSSADYNGLVQIRDVDTGRIVTQYDEHKNKVWSVDFCRLDPTKLASGGDDRTVKLWSINEETSICTIPNDYRVCCVQFSPYSSNLLSFGTVNKMILCYDLRHTRIPWCTLTGHDKTVSYVRFLNSETLVSASVDNTLKHWDLYKTTIDGISPQSCTATLRGHVNKKNFVGLSVLDGFMAIGSETNEVYAYYKSLPLPIASHEFGFIDSMFESEITNTMDDDGPFVSSVCWIKKSQMLAAANSAGYIKILRMV